jgi:hypothetical protein
MMKLDRGNKDQSPHKKVRSNHELDFRKNRLVYTSFLNTMIPALLFLVFWGGRNDIDRWEYAVLTTGSGLIVLGCLYILFSLLIMNKDTASNNIISSAMLFFGGLLYFVGSIGIVEDLADGKHHLFTSNIVNHLGRNESAANDGIGIRDSIYWFGLFSLIAFNSIMLALDIIADLFFAQYLRIAFWSWPLLFGSAFAWGVFLRYKRKDLSWWEVTGDAGFGTIAISNLLIMLASLIQVLIKPVGTLLAFFSFLGSVAVWIYHAAYIDKYVFDGSDACFYIGIPFLLSAQSLFLMYDCFLGTKEPKDGAAAHTVHRDNNPNDPNLPNNRNVNVPVQ